MSALENLEKYISSSINTKKKIYEQSEVKEAIVELAYLALHTLQNGGKLIFAGNGGSFSDSQHLATEFVSRFMTDRAPLPALALGTNNSNLSAIGNDYGFQHVFARELQVIANTKDLFLPISTSGNSKNIIEAVKVAKELRIQSIGLTGNNNSVLSSEIKCIKVPSSSTAYIQECHIMIGHFICKFVEEEYF